VLELEQERALFHAIPHLNTLTSAQ
jgi:hypothetical protein